MAARPSEQQQSRTGERERAGGCQCVRVNQEENTAGVAAGKFTVAALRFYRIMSLTFILLFFFIFFDCFYGFSGVLA